MVSTLLLFSVLAASASSRPVSVADYNNDTYQVHAELYYDSMTKRPDLSVSYAQKRGEDGKYSFSATSFGDRVTSSGWVLKPAPPSRMNGETLLIYYGFDKDNAYYDGNHSFAVAFRMPVTDLDDKTAAFLTTNFPHCVVSDVAGKARYFKSVLLRITQDRVYPVAAFDVELVLPGPR